MVYQSLLWSMIIAQNLIFVRQIITGTRDSWNGKGGKVLHPAKVILIILYRLMNLIKGRSVMFSVTTRLWLAHRNGSYCSRTLTSTQGTALNLKHWPVQYNLLVILLSSHFLRKVHSSTSILREKCRDKRKLDLKAIAREIEQEISSHDSREARGRGGERRSGRKGGRHNKRGPLSLPCLTLDCNNVWRPWSEKNCSKPWKWKAQTVKTKAGDTVIQRPIAKTLYFSWSVDWSYCEHCWTVKYKTSTRSGLFCAWVSCVIIFCPFCGGFIKRESKETCWMLMVACLYKARRECCLLSQR